MDEKSIEKIVSSVLNQLNTDGCSVTLDRALALAERIKEKAREKGVNVAIAVSDSSARPVLVECMDNALIAAYDVAFNKAFTVVALKMPTIELKKLAQPGGSLYGIQHTNEGKIVIFGGGEPLYDNNGRLAGGLGVSGGTEEQDTFLAKYGRECYCRKD